MSFDSNTENQTTPPPPQIEDPHEQYLRTVYRRKIDQLLSGDLTPEELENQFVAFTKVKERQANRDIMPTKFLNKRAFIEALKNAIQICRRHQIEATLAMMDGDDFKRVNDTYGHQVGDKMILAICKGVAKSVRDNDIKGRFGGDEIAVLLMGTNPAGAQIVVDRINQNVPETAREEVPEVDWEQTISVGLAQLQDDDTEETLVKRADQALYESKKGKRDKIATAV